MFVIFLLSCAPNSAPVVREQTLLSVSAYKLTLEESMGQVIADLQTSSAVDPVVIAQAELELAVLNRRFAPWTISPSDRGFTKVLVGECIGPGVCGGFTLAVLPNMLVGYSSRSHLLVVSPNISASDPELPFEVFGALSNALLDIRGEPQPGDTPIMRQTEFEAALHEGVRM